MDRSKARKVEPRIAMNNILAGAESADACGIEVSDGTLAALG
jgi:hypothetical protein